MHGYGVIEFIFKMIHWSYFLLYGVTKQKSQVEINTDFYKINYIKQAGMKEKLISLQLSHLLI